jgi:predicted GNAT family acetyltransferase
VVAVEIISDIENFRSIARSVLCQTEAVSSLFLSRLNAELPFAARVREEGKPEGIIALCGSQFLGVSALSSSAALEVAKALKSHGVALPGVLGPKETVTSFLKHAEKLLDRKTAFSVTQQWLEQRQIRPNALKAKGRLRLAHERDLSTIAQWNEAYATECGFELSEKEAKAAAQESLRTGTRYVWDRYGEIVAMLTVEKNTPSGFRLNWVYVPGPYRSKGLGSALIQEVSQKHIVDGSVFCFACVDLDQSPTPSVFEKAGYAIAGETLYVHFAE